MHAWACQPIAAVLRRNSTSGKKALHMASGIAPTYGCDPILVELVPVFSTASPNSSSYT